jgi:RimJ/RimL family protein N-acetyltransferase
MSESKRWRMTGDLYRVLEFFNSKTSLPESVGMKAIGLERDGVMVAGVVYEGYNGANVWVHLAAEPGAQWMTREYLRYCFHYPFNELGVQRLSGYVDASNANAIRLNEHFGYQREALLKGAAPSGGDVIIYVMRKPDCRYLDKN